jgi:hypothetical protein
MTCMAAACCGMQFDSDLDFAFLHLISEFPTHEPECQSGFKFARPSLPVELPVRATRGPGRPAAARECLAPQP